MRKLNRFLTNKSSPPKIPKVLQGVSGKKHLKSRNSCSKNWFAIYKYVRGRGLRYSQKMCLYTFVQRSCHAPLGDSLAVELSALDRAAMVRIHVPQPSIFTLFELSKNSKNTLIHRLTHPKTRSRIDISDRVETDFLFH